MLDEPTRSIDVGAKFGSTSSSWSWRRGQGHRHLLEMPELLGITDRIMVMSNGRVAGSSTPKRHQSEICAWHLCTYKDRKTLWSRKNFNLMQALKESGIYVVLLVLLMIIVIKGPPSSASPTSATSLTQSSVQVIIALGWRASSSPGY